MNNPSDWIYHGSGLHKRIEANLSGNAYSAHRHPDYTLALTMRGVQSFHYRGQQRHSLPGQVVILHPDELHDGKALTDVPFRYRGIAINPTDIQDALEGAPLPFVENGISKDPTLALLIQSLLRDLTRPLTTAEYQDALYDLSQALLRLSGFRKLKSTPNFVAVRKAKEFIDDSFLSSINMDELSKVAGHSKWQLSRDFREVYGTSPYRYLVFKRLEKTHIMVRLGSSLATAATTCGFADQSHFSRHFKKAFGISPKKWSKLIQHSHDHAIF